MPSAKPQLWYMLYSAIPQELMGIATSHVGTVVRYLLKHNIKPKNRKTTIYNIVMVLMGHIENQSEETINIAYTIFKESQSYAIKLKQGSSSIISERERAIRERRSKDRQRQIDDFKRGISSKYSETTIKYGPSK